MDYIRIPLKDLERINSAMELARGLPGMTERQLMHVSAELAEARGMVQFYIERAKAQQVA